MSGRPPSPGRPPLAPGQPAARHSISTKRWWPWVSRLLKLLFFAAVTYLLVSQARAVDWQQVLATLRQRPLGSLAGAVAFGAASYALYSCFDLLGRHYTGHQLPARQVVTVTFISYAFNLNLGALVGGVAFRYRLYSRLGLDNAATTQVLFLSMLTNWLGYVLLAGLAFWWWPISLPSGWKLDPSSLRLLGIGLFAVSLGYLLLCAFARRRTWTIRGEELRLPSLRLALLQLLMSTTNWLLIACTVYTLLGQKIAFPDVLSVLLIAAIAGVLTHVPAGLGVLEVVFVTLLSDQLPKHELLAALLAYRAIYYLAPLIIAALFYLAVEIKAKKAPREQGQAHR